MDTRDDIDTMRLRISLTFFPQFGVTDHRCGKADPRPAPLLLEVLLNTGPDLSHGLERTQAVLIN